MRQILIALSCTFIVFTFLLKTEAKTNPPSAALAPLLTPTVTSTVTPTPTPTALFSATMTIIPSQNQVAIHDTLVVTVAIDVSQGCSFPVYEFMLQQTGEQGALFDYVSPPTATIGPPGTNPFTYALRATTPGEVSFNGQAYGERYCNDFWNWTYVYGVSPTVRVEEEAYHRFLPIIMLE